MRFARFAAMSQWPQEKSACSPSPILTWRAFDCYGRFPQAHAVDYDEVKMALMKRHNLTEDGFRICKSEEGESTEMFIIRIKTYLNQWVMLLSAPSNLR
ncbi:reverse transcriptase [Plakobranchus ocellatus]|uniref:Reverse transcriptase n=1 Tax=Plakobranchus ocellatus TaxID=259542 RepID=A0AAV4A7Y7_9GAST|nr:reverse transcriptase [Plakobranchus ocellatus]